MEILKGWIRRLTPALRNVSHDDKLRYRDALRVAYFFSTTTLFGILYYKYLESKKESSLENNEEEQLLMGKPVIKDISDAHRKMRESGIPQGLLVLHENGRSIYVKYNREEYLEDMEKAAYDRARAAQAQAIAEGRQLPRGALRLV